MRTPIDGLFSNRLVNTGDFVAVGQRLGNVVPLDDVYIDANYKETQLKRIRVGQPVTIKVDAYGFRKFKGTVDSISPAAGSVFTLLPPDNATGNFTKIVQRVPVRVRVPKDVADRTCSAPACPSTSPSTPTRAPKTPTTTPISTRQERCSRSRSRACAMR